MRDFRARLPRAIGLTLTCLAILSSGTGCTHNYYYGNDPCGAPTAVVPGVVQYGNVCEVPSREVGAPSVVSAPSSSNTPVLSAGNPIGARPKPPRIVVSEPADRGRGFAWRPSDPEGGLARTQVEGAYGEPSLTR